MRRLAWLGLTCLVGCDLLLVEPASVESGVDVQLSVSGESSSPAVSYGNVTHVLPYVHSLALRVTHGDVDRDTVIRAVARGDSVQVRIGLRPEESRGWLVLAAELRAELGEPLFRGQALVNARAPLPVADIELLPVAAIIVADENLTFTALGDSIAINGRAHFANGVQITGAQIEWSAGLPEVVEIVGSRAYARANGSSTVHGRFLGSGSDLPVVVRQVPVQLTGVGPADTTVSVGAIFQARPFGVDRNGFPLLPGAGVAWRARGTVTVDAQGRVTAASVGQGFVDLLQAGAAAHTMSVTVTP